MTGRYLAVALLIAMLVVAAGVATVAAETFKWGEPISLNGVKLTKESRDCVACHLRATPFIVYDWYKSVHREVGVGCYECHAAQPGTRPDVERHYGYYITLIVTPKQCARCHPAVVEEFEKSVHAFAGLHAYALKEFPAYWTIVADQFGWSENFTIPAEYIETEWVPKIVREFTGNDKYGIVVLEQDPTNEIIPYNPLGLSIDNYNARKALYIWGIRGCLACHGVRMDVKDAYAYPSLKTLMEYMKEGKAPEKVIFDPAFITNHGIGRVNPDGSLGSCEACHPYHSFSVKIARKGAYQACGRCHCGPDHPNDEQWSKSVHGAIYWGEAEDWDWDKPVNNWVPGRDFRAPTCVTCHMAAVYDERGNVLYASSHDVAIINKFKLGRWVMTLPRVAGLPDPAFPGATAKKPAVFTSPTTGVTIKLVYPEPGWKERRERAIAMCSQCHTKIYAASWLKTFDWMIILVDYMRDKYVLTIANMLKEKGLFTPMDKWKVRNLGAMANRPTKMAAAHFGPDFVWWDGIMHFTEWLEEWLIDVAERPAVRKNAPEIVHMIEEILPWYKTKVEGIATTAAITKPAVTETRAGKLEKTIVERQVEEIVTVAKSNPEIVKYARSIGAVETAKKAKPAKSVETVEPKPLVIGVKAVNLGAVKTLTVNLGGQQPNTGVLALFFAALPVAAVVAYREARRE